MRVGSLFSGVGGFDLGFERAGFEIAWQAENDKHASAVLAKHWPDVWNYGDVKAVTHGVPTIDVLVGGFPCTDVSVAGRRAGLAGERSGLWFEFRRIIGELRPRFVVIENVPGLFSSNQGRDFGTILGGLVNLGYRVAWRVLDAQYAGLAQRRKRVFIVASLGDGRCAEVLFEREGVSGNPPARGETGEDIAGSLGGGSSSRGWPADTDRMTFTVSPTLQAGGNATGGHRPPGTTVDTVASLIVAPALSASMGHHGRSSPRGDGSDALVFEPRFARNGRGAPSDIAYPLTAEAGRTGKGDSAMCVYVPEIVPNAISAKWAKGAGGPAGDEIQNLVASSEWIPASVETLAGGAHPGGLNGQEAETQTLVQHGAVRRLTPGECERLQGFPDDWTAGQADSHRYRQLGNAVAIPVAEWIGRQLLRLIALEAT